MHCAFWHCEDAVLHLQLHMEFIIVNIWHLVRQGCMLFSQRAEAQDLFSE